MPGAAAPDLSGEMVEEFRSCYQNKWYRRYVLFLLFLIHIVIVIGAGHLPLLFDGFFLSAVTAAVIVVPGSSLPAFFSSHESMANGVLVEPS